MRTAQLIVASTIFTVASSLNAEPTRQLQVLGPNGMPAVAATVTLLRSLDDGTFETTVLKTDQSGWFETDQQFNFDDSILVVDAPDAAVGIWHYIRAEQTTLQLIEAYQVRGVIHGPDGKPLLDADVRVDDFGTETYTPLGSDLRPAVTRFESRTNARGEFSLPGMSYNGFEFAAGVIILATREIDGVLHCARWRSDFGGDSTALERHREVNGEDEPIRLAPISRIRGRVASGIDGRPMADAKLRFGYVTRDHASEVLTGADGRFEIEMSTFGLRRLSISHPDLMKVVRITEKSRDDQANVNIDDMEIVLWPKTRVHGTVVDDVSGKPTRSRLAIIYKRETEFRKGWMSTERGSSSLPYGGVKTDGTFDVELPAGELPVQIKDNVYSIGHSAYQHSITINVDPAKPEIGRLRIPRREGLYVHMRSSAGNALTKEQLKSLVVSAGVVGDNRFGYADEASYWFYPVHEWGDQVYVQIEQRLPTGERVPLLPKKIFETAEDLWPQLIEIDPADMAAADVPAAE